MPLGVLENSYSNLYDGDDHPTAHALIPTIPPGTDCRHRKHAERASEFPPCKYGCTYLIVQQEQGHDDRICASSVILGAGKKMVSFEPRPGPESIPGLIQRAQPHSRSVTGCYTHRSSQDRDIYHEEDQKNKDYKADRPQGMCSSSRLLMPIPLIIVSTGGYPPDRFLPRCKGRQVLYRDGGQLRVRCRHLQSH